MLTLLRVKKLIYWAFYDFANSSYVLIFQAFLLPVYFSTNLISFGFDKGSWGLANGLSTLIGVGFAVIAGSYSDRKDRLKMFERMIYLSAIGMASIALFVWLSPALVFYVYIITNSFFITTISLSDSLLTFIADKGKTNEYSGFAWGWGYAGGIVCLLAVMAVQAFTQEFSPFVFLFVGLFYFVFSLYALKGLRGYGNVFTAAKPEGPDADIKEINKIKTKNKLLLLIGYWLISESITVIILFFSIYASQELHLESGTIGKVLLSVQFIGIFTTWFGGKLADKYSTSLLLGATILGWIAVVLLLVYVPTLAGLVAITIITGFVIGNSQSYLRAQFSQIVNKFEAGYQFGLFSIASQAAVVVGPVLHGYLSEKLGSQKIPLLIVIIFLIVGFLLTIYTLKKINATNSVAA